MKLMISRALFCLICLTLSTGNIMAQNADDGRTAPDAAASEPLLTPDDYNIKAYRLSVYGGWFSGSTYFNPRLDPLGPRTYLAEGVSDVIGFDGEVIPFDLELHDAPVKEIDPGRYIGAKIAMYLNPNFHLDLVGSYSQGEARITFLNLNPDDPENMFREIPEPPMAPGDVDTPEEEAAWAAAWQDRFVDQGFKVYKGGVHVMYDLSVFRTLGLEPYIGFGLGGIINRFSNLEDKTALYFSGVVGLNAQITNRFSIFSQATTTTFNFLTEELHYGKTLTYFHAAAGLSWYIDTIPDAVKAAADFDE